MSGGRDQSYVERVLARAGADPGAPLLADAERRWRAGEFSGLVHRLARALADRGLGRGSRVALLATISPAALAIRYAANLLGGATVFCPNHGSDADLRAFVTHARPDALVVFPRTAPAAAGLITAGSIALVMSAGPVPGIELDLLAAAADGPGDPVRSQARPDDLGVLVSSGGTTGANKASCRSFAAYLQMVDAGPTPGRRQLVCTALAYVAQVLADQVLIGGGTVVFRDGFEPAEVLRTIEFDRISHLGLVEPGLVELIDHPDLPARELTSLVAVSHIGADAPANLRRRLLERAGPVLAHPYGASEAGMISILAGPEYDVSRPELLSTVGRPFPDVRVTIERADGSLAAADEDGLVIVQSAAIAEGYDVELPQSGFVDGRYLTGDLGRLDAGGFLHVRGRAADARERAGRTVMPLDIADALCAHPSVRYAVAVPLEVGFGAIVTLAADAGETATGLGEHLRRRHGDELVPEAIVIAERIPTTEQGKPDRRAIQTALAPRLP